MGARVAVESINAAGGFEGVGNINFINYDDAAQPDQASSIAQRLIERDPQISADSRERADLAWRPGSAASPSVKRQAQYRRCGPE